MAEEVTQPAQDTTPAGTSETATPQTPAPEVAPQTPAQEAAKPDTTTTHQAPEAKPESTQGVPEKYDLKLPDGSHLKPAELERIAAEAKARGLTNEQAQAEVNRESQSRATYLSELQKEHTDLVEKKWPEMAKADTEIGGAEFTKNVELAHRVLKKFATEDFMKDLEISGYGNHPGLLMAFVRIGRAMGEDQLIIPTGQAPTKARTIAEVLYGSNE